MTARSAFFNSSNENPQRVDGFQADGRHLSVIVRKVQPIQPESSAQSITTAPGKFKIKTRRKSSHKNQRFIIDIRPFTG